MFQLPANTSTRPSRPARNQVRSQISLARCGFSGDHRAESALGLAVPARGAQRLPLPDAIARPADPAAELIRFRDGTTRGERLFAEDIGLALPEPRYQVWVRSTEVIVTTETLLRDLALFPDRFSPWSSVDDRLIILLPGESATFHVRGLGSRDDYSGPPVVRCANDLGWRTWT
jgi:beta-mannosidase